MAEPFLSHEDQLTRELIQQRDKEIREDVALGVEAKNFLTSPLARYITKSAEITVADAQGLLANVDPTDTQEIVRLQGIIRTYNHFFGCLSEIVAAGDTAYQIYLQEHSSEA